MYQSIDNFNDCGKLLPAYVKIVEQMCIYNAWLNSIVAFLNSEGGLLLAGVADNGEIVGIDHDQFENEDRYLLYVNNKNQQHIGLEHARSIRFNLEPIGGSKVLVVECVPTSSPVFLREGKNESLFCTCWSRHPKAIYQRSVGVCHRATVEDALRN